jgi:hypothetical protein
MIIRFSWLQISCDQINQPPNFFIFEVSFKIQRGSQPMSSYEIIDIVLSGCSLCIEVVALILGVKLLSLFR